MSYPYGGINAVSLGPGAGSTLQGAASIAIGYYAGAVSQPASSIVINATGSTLNGISSGITIAPIRNLSSGNILMYNTLTNEVVYSTMFTGIFTANNLVATTVTTSSLQAASQTTAVSNISTLNVSTFNAPTIKYTNLQAINASISTLDVSTFQSVTGGISTLGVSTLNGININYSILTGSAITTSNASVTNILTVSSLLASTLIVPGYSFTGFSTLTGSTLNASTITTSTLTTNNALVNSTLTVCTLVASTIIVPSLNLSQFSTITGSSIIASTLLLSTMTTNTAVVNSTLTVSTLIASTIIVPSLNLSQFSTITGSSIFASTLVLSTMNTNNAIINSTLAVSTLLSNTAIINSTLTVSTLIASTIIVPSLNLSQFSTITGSSIIASTLLVSTITLNTSFINSTLIVSTLIGNNANINSTLTVCTLVASTIIVPSLNLSQFSTLTGSTINASTLFISTTNTINLNVQNTTYSTLTGSTISSNITYANLLLFSSISSVYGSSFGNTGPTGPVGNVSQMAYKLGTPQNIVPTPTLTTVVKWVNPDVQQSINSTGLLYNVTTGLFTNNTILPLPIAIEYMLNLDITAGGYTAVGLNGSTELFGGAYNDTNSFSNSCIILVPAGLSFGIYYMDNTTVNIQASSRISCTLLTAGGQGSTGTTGPTGPNAQSALASYTLSVVQNIPAQTAAMVKWNTADSGQSINNVPITLTTTGGNTGLFTNGTLVTLPVLVEYNLQLDVSGGGSSYIQLGGTASGVFGSMLTTTNIIRNSFVVSLIPGATMAVYYYDNSIVNVQTTYSRITLTVLQVGPGGPSGPTGSFGPTGSNFWGYTGGTGPYGGTGINNSIQYSQGYVGIGQGPTGSTYLDTTRGGSTAGTGSYVPQYQLDVAGTVRSAVHAYMDNSAQITASPVLDFTTFGQNWITTNASVTNGSIGCAISANGQYQIQASILAGSNASSGAYYSSNYGQTWTQSNASTSIAWISCAMSASGQYAVLTGSGGVAIYISSNYGQTWTATSQTTTGQIRCAISASGQYMIAGCGVTGTPTSIYVSSNYGQTWTTAGPALTWYSFAMSASGQYMYGGTSSATNSIYISNNYGQTWNPINTGFSTTAFSMSSSASGQYVCCSDTSVGVSYYSSTYGQTWSRSNIAVKGGGYYGIAMSASGQYVVMGGGGDNAQILYYSTNYGQTFTSVPSSPIGNWFSVSISANGQYLLAAAIGGSFYQSVTRQPSLYTSGNAIVAGNVGIGTTAPSQKLQVNGNIFIGPTYQQLSLVGGNSLGFLYGCYAKYNDAIHIGYNFYNDNTSNTIFNAAGATSRITMGYGFIGLYTGAVNTEPTTLGLYQNSVGNVGIGIASPTSLLTIHNGGAYQTNHLIIRGQEFYTSSFTSTGIALNIGVSRTTNKQLWIMDPDLAINSTNPCIALSIISSNAIIATRSTDGTANLKTYIEGSSVILNGSNGGSTGNVGIGISSPAAKLDVNSTSTSSLVLQIAGPGEAYALASSAKNSYVPGGTMIALYNSTNSSTSGYLIDINVYNSDNNASDIYFGAVAGISNAAANFVIGRRTGVFSWAESVRVNTSGYVGIGTNAPSYPLHVNGSVSNTGSYWQYTGGGTSWSSTNTTYNISIYASNTISANGGFLLASDMRIKKNIKLNNGSLSLIQNIPIYYYEYIDGFMHGYNSSYDVIAQDINTILPEACHIETREIPNIFKLATSITNVDGIVTIVIPNTLVTGDIVKLQFEKKPHINVTVISATVSEFTTSVWDNYSVNESVFVYGKIVNDFIHVDKVRLGVLALSGVKELHSIVKEQQQIIQQQTAKIDTLIQRLTAAGIP